jgi:predicted NACHT family NTPase
MDFLRKRTLAKAIKNANNNHTITPLRKSSNIAFLFNNDIPMSDKQLISQWKKGMENSGKKITECIIINEKLKKGETASKEPLTLYKNHFRLSGEVKPEAIGNFLQQDFDYLILFENTPSMLLQILAASSNAKLRIGKNNLENQHICDFLINIPENADMESYILNLEKMVKAIAGG